MAEWAIDRYVPPAQLQLMAKGLPLLARMRWVLDKIGVHIDSAQLDKLDDLPPTPDALKVAARREIWAQPIESVHEMIANAAAMTQLWLAEYGASQRPTDQQSQESPADGSSHHDAASAAPEPIE